MKKILLLARKRILLNILSLKFHILFVLLQVLLLFSLLTGVNDYKKGLLYYNNDLIEHLIKLDPSTIYMYSQVELGFDRPPEKLSILVKGIGERYGSCAILKGKYGSTIIRNREKTNFFISEPFSFDFINILSIFISLMGIIFSCHIISGEKEEGVLQLVLSSPIWRHCILIGEYIGTILTLLIPLIFSFLLAIILLQIYPIVDFDLEMLIGILTLFVITVILSSFFTLLGILVSSLTKQSNTSTIVAFLVWLFFVIILPNLILWISTYCKPVEPLYKLSSMDIISKMTPIKDSGLTSVNNEKKEKENLIKRFEQADFANRLSFFSPLSSTVIFSQIIAGTDIFSHKKYLEQIKRLERSLIKWQEDRVKKYPHREFFYEANWGPVDLEGLPSSEFKKENLLERLNRGIPYIAFSIIFNILLFYLSFIFFSKYDSRFS